MLYLFLIHSISSKRVFTAVGEKKKEPEKKKLKSDTTGSIFLTMQGEGQIPLPERSK